MSEEALAFFLLNFRLTRCLSIIIIKLMINDKIFTKNDNWEGEYEKRCD